MPRIYDDVDIGDSNGDDEEGRDAYKCGDDGDDKNDYGYDYQTDADDDDVVRVPFRSGLSDEKGTLGVTQVTSMISRLRLMTKVI
jgi:hypothetical protein